MTYKINGVQYWKRNGVYCSWTEEGGRKVITREEYLEATGKTSSIKKDVVESKVEEIVKDPKSKVEIAYQEIGKSGNILTKKKVVTYGNLDKVITNMKAKDNFVTILGTRDV